jgi:hypothetical protein
VAQTVYTPRATAHWGNLDRYGLSWGGGVVTLQFAAAWQRPAAVTRRGFAPPFLFVRRNERAAEISRGQNLALERVVN